MKAPPRQQFPLPSLSSCDRDGVTVVNLPDELDLSGCAALRVYLSGIRRQTSPRSVADLTGLAYIDCACLGVLVRHCIDSRERGGSFALAGVHGAVHRILALTGLLAWFDVHDTVDEALGHIGTQQSLAWPAILAAGDGTTCSGTFTNTDLPLSSRLAEGRRKVAAPVASPTGRSAGRS